jgi:hypothetical protein
MPEIVMIKFKLHDVYAKAPTERAFWQYVIQANRVCYEPPSCAYLPSHILLVGFDSNSFDEGLPFASVLPVLVGLEVLRRELVGLAEFERDLIRVRTGEGRERAKARGVRLGRRPKLTIHQRREAIARRESGEPLAEIGRSHNHSTISRLGE